MSTGFGAADSTTPDAATNGEAESEAVDESECAQLVKTRTHITGNTKRQRDRNKSNADKMFTLAAAFLAAAAIPSRLSP